MNLLFNRARDSFAKNDEDLPKRQCLYRKHFDNELHREGAFYDSSPLEACVQALPHRNKVDGHQ